MATEATGNSGGDLNIVSTASWVLLNNSQFCFRGALAFLGRLCAFEAPQSSSSKDSSEKSVNPGKRGVV